jgi:O-succinylbenzoic acid--CoA ligase
MTDLSPLECSGPAVLDTLLPAVAAALDGTGPAVLPLPAGPPAVRDALLAAMRPDRPLERPDVAAVVPTSGSTGEPKGVLLTATALRHSAAATVQRLGGPGGWLLALSPTHVAGLQVLVRSVLAGTTPQVLDLSGGFHPDAFAAATARLDPTAPRYTALVPTQLRRLLEAGVDLSTYDAVLVGGAALAFDRPAGARVLTTYGMSETSGGCVYDGRPLDGVDVRVDGAGRVTIGGPVVFAGYRLRPDLTARALVGGRHVTQDLGRWTADGRLEVLGRADDVIVSGAVNVPAAWVERVLDGHPSVRRSAVVGRPDPEWGERVVAVVEPAGDPAPTLAALQEHARDRLDPSALPRELVLVGRLPLLASGKPDKAAVRRLVAPAGRGH